MAGFGSTNATPLLQASDSENGETDSLVDNEIIYSETKPIFRIPEPKDNYYIAFIIFYLIGMTTLLPWNFFVTADDYWMYKFRDVNASKTENVTKRTQLQAEFTSYVNVSSAVPTIVFLIINTLVTQWISVHKRMLGSLILMLILFIVTTICVNINTDQWQQQFLVLTLCIVALLNVTSAILSGGLYGIIGKFGPAYITAVVGGQALGGIFAAIVQIISLAIGASSLHSALVYFTIGNITIVICIVSYIILCKSVFFKFHLREKVPISDEFQNILIRPEIISYRTILSKIRAYGISLFLVFGITMVVYPGVTVLIESEGRGKGHAWNDVYFVPTINYLLFNTGDYLGRIVAGRIQKPKGKNLQVLLSVARIIFVPLLLLCNAQPRHNLPVVFNKDYIYIIFLLIFALSNGYLANLSSMWAPRVVEHHEKEVAASMLTVFLGMGLCFGSGVSLFLVKVL